MTLKELYEWSAKLMCFDEVVNYTDAELRAIIDKSLADLRVRGTVFTVDPGWDWRDIDMDEGDDHGKEG